MQGDVVLSRYVGSSAMGCYYVTARTSSRMLAFFR